LPGNPQNMPRQCPALLSLPYGASYVPVISICDHTPGKAAGEMAMHGSRILLVVSSRGWGHLAWSFEALDTESCHRRGGNIRHLDVWLATCSHSLLMRIYSKFFWSLI
jgi:hypothetical protein